ncbi:hypothetical protein THRCLA_07870 [Thraustotheca clavata]|uniref:Uncharacterized protein n=1 Tax=Thraustotheca clavata TaxID=74557 RepID=A0A1V9ZBS2_9STRA|nr:hypothetical protein THRCLA_07870 [Thraustotheca clavata]
MEADSVVVCCKRERWEVAKGLIGCGADVNEALGVCTLTNNMHTALHFAAMHGNMDMCKYLITRKAKVNAAGKDGITPLHLAVAGKHRMATLYLINSGANIQLQDKKEREPFLHAPWHEMMFPCLLTPLHTTISSCVERVNKLQHSNLAASNELNHKQAAVKAKSRELFNFRTHFYDNQKHRQLSIENCRALKDEICRTKADIQRTCDTISTLERESVQFAALIVETEDAIVQQTNEYKSLVQQRIQAKETTDEVQQAIVAVEIQIQEKYETLKVISMFNEREHFQEVSCKALVKLTANPENTRKLLLNGLIPNLLSMLSRYPKNYHIQVMGCTIFFHIIETTGSFPPLYLERAVQIIATALVALRYNTTLDYSRKLNLVASQNFLDYCRAQQETTLEPRLLRSIKESIHIFEKKSQLPNAPLSQYDTFTANRD